MTININQFEQAPIKGQLDLQISKSGVISGVVGANQSAALVAGDPVAFESYTSGAQPQFVKAAYNAASIGCIVADTKKESFVAGDTIEVAFFGVVIYQVAKATIAPGAIVEQHSDGTYQTFSAGVKRGIALDPAVAAGLFRMIIMPSIVMN